ncbi:UvrD-helicase domain-containing protein [Tenacibaculum aiptasiae]|uniref:UvrD-helicase domain-containing protein n=1 Tax=Tenacibaculum aiptasiae TaxID=426481 RepID=UPI003B5B3139
MEQLDELPKILENIDNPFKISAGPGAGKTTWLVSHIQNILRNSNNLGKTQKIGCITYTRIGADTVNKKVKKITNTNRLDIGTIHSFLYRNIIKPFSYLIENEIDGTELFNIKELSGHIENRLIWDRLRSWKSEIEKDNGKNYNYFNYADNRKSLISKLSSIDYTIDTKTSNIQITFRKSASNYNVAIPTSNNELLKYKKAYWRKGIMHHEDVLYFTHFIFSNYPRIKDFISNKFPYLFLDEFQDTNPLQTWIINEIAKKGTIVGVIGDPAQSIFEFAGAQRKDFQNFTLPNIQNFKKSKNYRSSITIIDFLKELRDDIVQIPKKTALKGEPIKVLVSTKEFAIKLVNELDSDDFAILCRWNKEVNQLKNGLKKVEGTNLISQLYAEDSNHKRPTFIHSLIKAYDFNDSFEFKDAIKEITKHLHSSDLMNLEKRKFVIEIIDYLKDNLNSSIENIYKYLQPKLKKHSVMIPGLKKAKSIHKKSFKDFIPFLSKQTKVSSKIRTIHQAKGDEFKNVLICLDDKTNKNGSVSKKLETILNDYIFKAKNNITLDTDIGEETRLIYVACSRAKERLFINIPRLSREDEVKMIKLGMLIERK